MQSSNFIIHFKIDENLKLKITKSIGKHRVLVNERALISRRIKKFFNIFSQAKIFLVFPYIEFCSTFFSLSPFTSSYFFAFATKICSRLDCCNYQQRNLIKKIYAIKLCVIFESLLLPRFLPFCAGEREFGRAHFG